MKYTEITLKITDNQSLRESIMAQLLEIGYESFMETYDSVVAYIDEAKFDENLLQGVLKDFTGKAVFEKATQIPDQNWNAIWESSYDPVIIEDKCIVRAPFHEKHARIYFDIVIQPKMSFGTAHHSTTHLMLQMMLEHDFAGKRVLDMGSGTGVLAIMASKKGAEHVTAIDNDQWAYNNAIENCELNGIKNIDVIFGDVSAIKSGVYDVVLANINRNILLEDIKYYNRCINYGAMILLSGFYEKDLAAITAEAKKTGWFFINKRIKNDWVAAQYSSSSSKPDSD